MTGITPPPPAPTALAVDPAFTGIFAPRSILAPTIARPNVNLPIVDNNFTGFVDIAAASGTAAVRPWDLTRPAQAGDILHIGGNFHVDVGVGGATLRFATIVAGAVVNPTDTVFVPVDANITLDIWHTVQAGDIEDGLVRLRLQTSATNVGSIPATGGFAASWGVTGPF